MNKCIYISSVSLAILYVSAMQAYTFTVKNFTNKSHPVAVQLKGFGQKQSESQTVERYQTRMAPQMSKLQEMVNKISGLQSDLSGKLTELQATLSKNVTQGVANVNDVTQSWVNKLETLGTNLSDKMQMGMKAVTNYDLTKLGQDLDTLSADINRKIDSGMVVLDANMKQAMRDLDMLRKKLKTGIENINVEKMVGDLEKLQGTIAQKIQEKVATIDMDAMARDAMDELTMLQRTVEAKIREGVDLIDTQQWAKNLAELRDDIAKGVKSGLDKINVDQLVGKIATLKDDITSEKAKDIVTTPDIVRFKFGGLRQGLCLSKIYVDGNPLPIYGVPAKEYDLYQAKIEKNANGLNEFIAYLNNRAPSNDMSTSLVGICFSRQYDIIDLGGDEGLVIITREMF